MAFPARASAALPGQGGQGGELTVAGTPGWKVTWAVQP